MKLWLYVWGAIVLLSAFNEVEPGACSKHPAACAIAAVTWPVLIPASVVALALGLIPSAGALAPPSD